MTNGFSLFTVFISVSATIEEEKWRDDTWHENHDIYDSPYFNSRHEKQRHKDFPWGGEKGCLTKKFLARDVLNRGKREGTMAN